MTSDHDRGPVIDVRHPRRGYADAIGVTYPRPSIADAIARLVRAVQDAARVWGETAHRALRLLAGLADLPTTDDIREARHLLTHPEVQRLVTDPAALAAAVEVKVSGAEGAYYVRTGLGTWIYHNDAAVDVLVKRTMRARPEDPDDPVHGMTVAHRARLAAAAIRGYVERGAGVS